MKPLFALLLLWLPSQVLLCQVTLEYVADGKRHVVAGFENARAYTMEGGGKRFLPVPLRGEWRLEVEDEAAFRTYALPHPYALWRPLGAVRGYQIDIAPNLDATEENAAPQAYMGTFVRPDLDEKGWIEVMAWKDASGAYHCKTISIPGRVYKDFSIKDSDGSPFFFYLDMEGMAPQVPERYGSVRPSNECWVEAAFGDLSALSLRHERGELKEEEVDAAMHAAVLFGREDVLKSAIGWGAKPDTANAFFQRPLEVAIQTGNLSTLQVLIGAEVDANKAFLSNRTPVQEAIYFGHPDALKVLVEAGAKLTDMPDGMTPLEYAIEFVRPDIFKYLYDRADAMGRTSRNKDVNTSMFLRLCRQGSGLMVKCVYDRGIVFQDEQKHQALLNAVQGGNAEVLGFLLGEGLDVDFDLGGGNRPLHLLCEMGFADAAKVLLNEGADVSAVNVQGVTPLYLAVAKNHLDVVEVLLAAGADPNITPKGGLAPVWSATVNQNREMVRSLIDAGSVCHVNKRLAQPLLSYILGNDLEEVLGFVVDQCLSPDVQLYGDFPAIWVAQYYGAEDCQATLLDRGADVSMMDVVNLVPDEELDNRFEGRIKFPSIGYPLDLAERYGSQTVSVDFVVNEDGKVLFPRIESDLPRDLAYFVSNALLSWQLEVPKQRGHPVKALVAHHVKLEVGADEKLLYEEDEVTDHLTVLHRERFLMNATGMNKLQGGEVSVCFVVDEMGVPRWLSTYRGDYFTKSAMVASSLYHWKFKPATRNGIAVRTKLVLTLGGNSKE